MPGYGFVFTIGLRYFFDPGTVRFYCAMAVHADIEAGERGMPAHFNPGMTVTAVYFILSGVEFMGERNRLIWLIAFVVKQADFVVCQ